MLVRRSLIFLDCLGTDYAWHRSTRHRLRSGIITAACIFRLLCGRIPEAVLVGLTFWVAMVTFYPLRQSTGGQMSFTAWAVWVTTVSVVIAGIYALLRRSDNRS